MEIVGGDDALIVCLSVKEVWGEVNVHAQNPPIAISGLLVYQLS